MRKKIKILINKFKQHNIDGYVVPKNDDYFTEYSKVNKLKVISNFSRSSGLAIILKNKNYLFIDGRYTIQSKIESGKDFIIVDYVEARDVSSRDLRELSSESRCRWVILVDAA